MKSIVFGLMTLVDIHISIKDLSYFDLRRLSFLSLSRDNERGGIIE